MISSNQNMYGGNSTHKVHKKGSSQLSLTTGIQENGLHLEVGALFQTLDEGNITFTSKKFPFGTQACIADDLLRSV